MAQGRSTEIISMIKWIRASRLSIKNSLSAGSEGRPGVPPCFESSVILVRYVARIVSER